MILYIEKKIFEKFIDEKFGYLSYVEPKKEEIVFNNGKAYYYTGNIGNTIDIDKTYTDIHNKIIIFQDFSIVLTDKEIKPPKISTDEILKKLNVEPVEPKFKIVNKKVKVSPPKSGLKISKKNLLKAIDKINFS